MDDELRDKLILLFSTAGCGCCEQPSHVDYVRWFRERFDITADDILRARQGRFHSE